MSTESSGSRPRVDQRWLDNPRNVDRIVYTLYAVCVLLFLADIGYTKHPYFAVEGWFGFYAGFGLIAATVLVLVATQFRRLVKREETYYDPDTDERDRSADAG